MSSKATQLWVSYKRLSPYSDKMGWNKKGHLKINGHSKFNQGILELFLHCYQWQSKEDHHKGQHTLAI